MASLKFFQIGKANEEITRLEGVVAEQKTKIDSLEAAGGTNATEIAAEAEKLSTENTKLSGENTKLAADNAKLKADVEKANADKTAADAALKAEKDGFEAKAQQRVAAEMAKIGHPGTPKAGEPGAKKPAAGEPTGFNRVLAGCKTQYERVVKNN